MIPEKIGKVVMIPEKIAKFGYMFKPDMKVKRKKRVPSILLATY
jgi:hypothetical protein